MKLIVTIIFSALMMNLFGQSLNLSSKEDRKNINFKKEGELDMIFYKNEVYTGVLYSKKGKYEIRNGLAHGITEEYFQNGELKSIENYKNGIKHGVFKEYSRNGKILSTKKYKKKTMDYRKSTMKTDN